MILSICSCGSGWRPWRMAGKNCTRCGRTDSSYCHNRWICKCSTVMLNKQKFYCRNKSMYLARMRPQWVILNLSVLYLHLLQNKGVSFMNTFLEFFYILWKIVVSHMLCIWFVLIYVSGHMSTYFSLFWTTETDYYSFNRSLRLLADTWN